MGDVGDVGGLRGDRTVPAGGLRHRQGAFDADSRAGTLASGPHAASAQAEDGHRHSCQGDDRARYRPERYPGHGAAAKDARALQAEGHSGHEEH